MSQTFRRNADYSNRAEEFQRRAALSSRHMVRRQARRDFESLGNERDPDEPGDRR